MASDPEEGRLVLQDLLRRPSPDVAHWAVEQARALSKPGTNIQRQPIFHMAGALNAASVEEKQELVRNAIQGFGQLPPDQRAEALRFVVSTATAVQAAGAADPAAQEAEAPPLMKNIMAVVQEAKMNEMPKEEQKILAEEARQDAAGMVQPHQILEVVAELKPEERHQVTEALVEAKLVPQEQQAALEEALKPGGLADLLVTGMKFVSWAQENSGAFVAVPFGELFLALVLGVMSCSSGLTTWLRADAVYNVLTLAGVWFGSMQLGPVLEVVKADPMEVGRRWQLAEVQQQTLRRRLEQTIPGVEFQNYQLGAIGVLVALVFLSLGLLNTVVGLFEMFASVMTGCSILVMLASLAFLTLRCIMVFALLQVVGTLLAVPSGVSGAQRPLLQEGAYSSGNEGQSSMP